MAADNTFLIEHFESFLVILPGWPGWSNFCFWQGPESAPVVSVRVPASSQSQ